MHKLACLPESAYYGRVQPKKNFYRHLGADAAMKRLFVNQIDTITWLYKLAPGTVNVARGAAVTEIQVLHILLRTDTPDKAIFELLDRGVPYHLVFVLEYEGMQKLRIAYKEQPIGKTEFTVKRYYETEWTWPDDMRLDIQGLDLDAVYEHFVLQAGGEALETQRVRTADLAGAVARTGELERLRKQIAQKERAMKKEKQFSRKAELWQEIERLKKSIEAMA